MRSEDRNKTVIIGVIPFLPLLVGALSNFYDVSTILWIRLIYVLALAAIVALVSAPLLRRVAAGGSARVRHFAGYAYFFIVFFLLYLIEPQVVRDWARSVLP